MGRSLETSGGIETQGAETTGGSHPLLLWFERVNVFQYPRRTHLPGCRTRRQHNNRLPAKDRDMHTLFSFFFSFQEG